MHNATIRKHHLSTKTENTILDIEGFLSFGNSKGFVLKTAE